MILRLANKNEATACYRFINDARAYHKSMGFEQWRPDYPTQQTIHDDIHSGYGYVFEEDAIPVGYCCIIMEEEPAYRHIEGQWVTQNPYAVVHRMAFGTEKRGRGLSHAAFLTIKSLCLSAGIHSIRVDTQEENKVMQHILEKEGFVFCGIIQFGGGPKRAYEWVG